MHRSTAISEAILAHFSLPDVIMDAICDIAVFIANADEAGLFIFAGSDAVVFGQSQKGEKVAQRRYPRKTLVAVGEEAVETVSSGPDVPRLFRMPNRASFNLNDDNGVIGQLVLGFVDTERKLSDEQRNSLRKLARVAASNILQETVMSLAAQRFFQTIERDKE